MLQTIKSDGGGNKPNGAVRSLYGTGKQVLVDDEDRVIISPESTIAASVDPIVEALVVRTPALSDRLQVKGSPGYLYSFKGQNFGADMYVQLHDSAAAPADGSVPIYTLYVLQGQWFGEDFLKRLRFSNGLWIMASTTGDTLTAGGSMFVMAQYV